MKRRRLWVGAMILVVVGGVWLYAERDHAVIDPRPKYRNLEYGFILALPESWRGFSATEKKWTGNWHYPKSIATDEVRGPLIVIDHPRFYEVAQEIPVMIFTREQWNSVIEHGVGKPFLSVSAAPIPPSEIGRNSKYVFAIPPRYNYAFPVGWEEVDKIVQNKSLWAFVGPK